jgi:hypothetical protein
MLVHSKDCISRNESNDLLERFVDMIGEMVASDITPTLTLELDM